MYIDSHAHIDAPAFQADRHEVIQRAQSGGVEVILDIGAGYLEEGTIEIALALAERYDFIYLAFGLHPHDARWYDDRWEERLMDLSTHPRVLAWGEIGLDYHYDHSPRAVQRAVFRRQLQLARQRGLPVIIHTREAEHDTLDLLRQEWQGSGLSGIMHCFTGTEAFARSCLDLGLYISFSGILTFNNADALRRVAQTLPLDRILIETDCPLLAPVPVRGKRNEPFNVRYVAETLGRLRGLTAAAVGQITGENFRRLFHLPLESAG